MEYLHGATAKLWVGISQLLVLLGLSLAVIGIDLK